MSAETVEFRHANPAEFGDLALVMERANAKRDGNPLPTTLEGSQALEDVQQRMNRIEAWTYVAIYGEKIVGFALSHPLIDPKSPIRDIYTEHLSLLMIDPDYWGKHIASKLLDLAAEHARDTGKRRLSLWTGEQDNSRAHAVYSHKGFVLTQIYRASDHGPQVQYQLGL